MSAVDQHAENYSLNVLFLNRKIYAFAHNIAKGSTVFVVVLIGTCSSSYMIYTSFDILNFEALYLLYLVCEASLTWTFCTDV